MITKWQIHFRDDYGPGAIETDNREDMETIVSNLRSDPTAEDIWVEEYDPEEGWQS